MSHKYKLRYTLIHEAGNFTKADHIADTGLTDAFLLGSVLYPEDGSRSQAVCTYDGRTGKEWSDMELFKFWILMAKAVADCHEIPTEDRLIAQKAFETHRAKILGMQGL